MKSSMKLSVVIGAMALLMSNIASAEVVFGGISFDEATPSVPASATSITKNSVSVLPIPKDATSMERKTFDDVLLLPEYLKPRIVLLRKDLGGLKECEKGIKDFDAYLKEKYTPKGYAKQVIRKGQFAGTFDPSRVSFSKFEDEGKKYNITTGCKQEGGYITLYSQIDNFEN